MFNVRLVPPPGFKEFSNEKFRVRGKFQMIHRYQCSDHEPQKQEERLRHEIITQTLQRLEVLPFQGRIGIAVRDGSVFIHGDVSAWNQDAEFRIDLVLMETETALAHFARQHPGFRETIAISYFPDVFLLY